jgi:hypothetical protein
MPSFAIDGGSTGAKALSFRTSSARLKPCPDTAQRIRTRYTVDVESRSLRKVETVKRKA